MKAKISLREFLCPKFIVQLGLTALCILFSNSCLQRQAFAAHRVNVGKNIVQAANIFKR